MEITYDLTTISEDNIFKLDLIFEKLKEDYTIDPKSHPREIISYCYHELKSIDHVNNLRIVSILSKSGITETMKDRHNSSESYQKLTIEGFDFIGFEEQRKRQLVKQTQAAENSLDNSMEDLSTELQQRICWLHAIGVIDFIGGSIKNHSSNAIGSILSKGTGIPADTIRKTIDRIRDTNLLDRYNDYIDNNCSRLKIKRIK